MADLKNTDDDFVWRFKLESGTPEKRLYKDKRTELIRVQLKELLNVLYLTYNGKKVNVDGFTYYFEGDNSVYKISPHA